MLSPDQSKALEKATLPAVDLSLPPQRITFDSHSEAACALTLERYVPGWTAHLGETYQVPIGNKRHVDFLVRGVFVEYHPIVLQHEFKDSSAFNELAAALTKVQPGAKYAIETALAHEFHTRYLASRREHIDVGPHRGRELIVCCYPGAFYDRVIRRFSKSAPPRQDYLSEFNSILRSIKIK